MIRFINGFLTYLGQLCKRRGVFLKLRYRPALKTPQVKWTFIHDIFPYKYVVFELLRVRLNNFRLKLRKSNKNVQIERKHQNHSLLTFSGLKTFNRYWFFVKWNVCYLPLAKENHFCITIRCLKLFMTTIKAVATCTCRPTKILQGIFAFCFRFLNQNWLKELKSLLSNYRHVPTACTSS